MYPAAVLVPEDRGDAWIICGFGYNPRVPGLSDT